MKTKELIRRLQKAGFAEVNMGQHRKHRKFKHPDGRQTVVSKGNKEIPKGIVKMIEKQTKIKLT